MDKKLDLLELLGEDILAKFCKIANENGCDPGTVIAIFVKDYVVSGGHPDQVGK